MVMFLVHGKDTILMVVKLLVHVDPGAGKFTLHLNAHLTTLNG